jgi:methionyl-tRNA formyltransferase
MNKPLRIIFMGTPDFAVPTLQILVENGQHVVAVITAPDKPAGRGLKLQESPVKQYALSENIPVLQPTNLKSEVFVEELRSYQADLQIIVAFRMLPEAVWNMPRLGSFNIHASLLPQYRGAAPINWTIINGDTETGVSSFFLQHEIDTGDLIFQDKVAILPEDDFGSLYEKMKHAGAALALKTVQAIETENVPTRPQETTSELKSAPKIYKETCQINWNQQAAAIHNFVRGLSPYPTAWTIFDDKTFKIFKTEVLPDSYPALLPGEIITDGKTYLHVKTADGILNLLDLQMEGKKRMPLPELLRGYTFKNAVKI